MKSKNAYGVAWDALELNARVMLVLDGKPLFPTEASVYSTWVRGDHRSIVVRFDDGRRARIGFDQVTSVIATKRRKKAA